MLRQKKINKKNKFFNEKHNKKIKHYNSRKRIQYNTNNLKFKNKN